MSTIGPMARSQVSHSVYLDESDSKWKKEEALFVKVPLNLKVKKIILVLECLWVGILKLIPQSDYVLITQNLFT